MLPVVTDSAISQAFLLQRLCIRFTLVCHCFSPNGTHPRERPCGSGAISAGSQLNCREPPSCPSPVHCSQGAKLSMCTDDQLFINLALCAVKKQHPLTTARCRKIPHGAVPQRCRCLPTTYLDTREQLSSTVLQRTRRLLNHQAKPLRACVGVRFQS